MSRAIRDFLLRGALAFLATLVAAPVFAALLSTTPFHRVTTRVFLVSLAIAFTVRRGPVRLWPEKVRALGLRGPARRARFLLGTGTALAIFLFLLLASCALGGRELLREAYPVPLWKQLGGALLAGVAVGFFEELLCRGYLKEVLGGVASATLYSAAHFFRPAVTSGPASGYDPLLVVRGLPQFLGGWSDPRVATMGFLSLFLFGLALNRLRERTGTLYFGIGLHFGVVFAVEFYRRFFSLEATGAGPWVFGGPRLHDGVLGVLVMGVLLLGAYRFPLPETLSRSAP